MVEEEGKTAEDFIRKGGGWGEDVFFPMRILFMLVIAIPPFAGHINAKIVVVMLINY